MNEHKFTDRVLRKFNCRAVAVFTFLLGFGVAIVGAWFDFDPIWVGGTLAACWLSSYWLDRLADKLVQNELKSVNRSDMQPLSSDDTLRSRKWSPPWKSFRFSLKSLLVLTLFSCILFTCVGIRFKEIERQRAIAEKLEAKGTHVTYVRGNVVTIQPFGDVSDDDLALLRNFPHLNMLFLQDSHLGDSALRHTQGLKNLEWLVLTDLEISDSGVRQIVGLPRLRNLYLTGTLVTDDCVSHLVKLRNLTFLNLERTKITAEGIKKLREGLPNTEIEN